METKVLAAIMKLQSAQIMLTGSTLHTDLSIGNTEHGSLCLTAFVKYGADATEVNQILNTYTFEGAEVSSQDYAVGTTEAFTTYKVHAYISDLKD